jgi:hypothetical protein
MTPSARSGQEVSDLSEVGDQFVSVSDAAGAAARFRAANPDAVHSWLFSRGILDVLLDQPGCVGIRVYRGLGLDGTEMILVVGADQDGVSMVPEDLEEPSLIGEEGWPCPPFCASDTVLDR